MPRRLEMQGRRVWWPLRLKVNEVLCKVLCYHLTCLIQEQETLGIAPVFWKNELEEAEGRSDVLLMVRPGVSGFGLKDKGRRIMRALTMAFVLGLLGAFFGWAAGNSLPNWKEICQAFSLFGGLLAAILGAILGGVFDISQAIRNQGSPGRR